MNVPLRKYRKDFGHSYAFGIAPTLELLRRRPEAAMGVVASARSDRSQTAGEIRRLCRLHNLEFRVDDNCLARLGCKDSCAVVGVFGKYATGLEPTANHVILDRPQYAGNIGAIARTMIGFGFTNLAVIGPAPRILDPECVRASMGAVFALSFDTFAGFDDYRKDRPERIIHPFLVTGGRSPEEVRFRPPLSLLFGSEGSGLSQAMCRCGPGISIPQGPAIDSLNIAVAMGIALYEVSRRMGKPLDPSQP